MTQRPYVLRREQRVAAPREAVFDFFCHATNLEKITPPQLGFRIDTPMPIEMGEGTLIDYTIRWHFVSMLWRTRIAAWNPPHSFVDEQLRGPYARWLHTHSFDAEGDQTIIRDEVEYVLPLGLLGRVAHPLVAHQLRTIFDYRQEIVEQLFKK